jgi:hypothetical protein
MLVKTLDNTPLESSPQSSISSVDQDLKPTMTNRRLRLKKILVPILITFGVLGIISYFSLVLPAKRVVASLRQLEASGKEIAPLVKSQDLAGISTQLDKIKSDLDKVASDYRPLAWLKVVPFAGSYYSDGQAGISAGHELLAAAKLTVDAIAPYADVIGLKGLTGTGDGGKTAQDRITFIVNTLDKLQPQLSSIGENLSAAQKLLNTINPHRYPQEITGIKLRSQLADGINLVDQAASLVNDAKPLLESAPYILGIESPRKYLVLFQNDAEIRPTGGFLTGYAVIQVSKGKISTLQSDDIYKLDELFPKRIPAPDPIKKYHPLVPYWYLRDQNLSPDFKVSMETFFPNYELTKSPKVDGVVAVDTQLLVDLLKVTGPIGVPGMGTFSAENDPRCECPNVFYELQLLAGGEEPVVWDSVSGRIVKAPANYGNRKAFLGPLMYSVLANVMAQPKNKVPELVNTIFSAVQGKHVLIYFVDPKIEEAAEVFNLAGRVRETGGDYLLIVDTNFSGAKTNIWVTYKADSKVEISGDGTVTKTLTLTYSNPQAKAVKITQARNLNGLFRDWLRVYVPKGSELIEAKGFESGQTTGEDLGKTVFEGFFTLAPGNTRQLSFKYKLPTKMTSSYQLLIQKQGGAKVFPYTLSVNGKTKPEILLSQDTQVQYPF